MTFPPVAGFAGATGGLGHVPALHSPGTLALNANVLVLNKFYQAIRVINVKRAFALLCKELAEVIHIETDAQGQSKWHNLDFDSWQELSNPRDLSKIFTTAEYAAWRSLRESRADAWSSS